MAIAKNKKYMLAVTKRLAIIGGGPSGLFLYKRLIESGYDNLSIDIFEAKDHVGSGMPYSKQGANDEHITNVSGNEIPSLVTGVTDWIQTLPKETMTRYHLDPKGFNDFMTLPRLLFGEYLRTQFSLLEEKAQSVGIRTTLHLNSRVIDISDLPDKNKIFVHIGDRTGWEFDKVVVCTGHTWPVAYEGKVPGYFDSPYPPSKLNRRLDHEIAIRGSSLTAIDAIRTLARYHGVFAKKGSHKLSFYPNEDAEQFKIVMYSRHGFLPCVRFHLDDPRLGANQLLTKEEIAAHIKGNDGFLSLDFIFEKDFKEALRKKDPAFYETVKESSLEEFVNRMMGLRHRADAFALLRAEYEEAEQSISHKEAIYWKEMLAGLSFAMNYPAKHFSAEDMLRLREVLMPLISVVIAFVPQSSCEELLALHDVGKLRLLSVGPESHIETTAGGAIVYHYTDEKGDWQKNEYPTFIDCIGQRHLMLDQFPFKSLVKDGAVSPARLKFRSAEMAKLRVAEGNVDIEADSSQDFYLNVPGIAISDAFNVIGADGTSNPRIYLMAVPFIGGYNPDYSGLDFCEEASKIIVRDIFLPAGIKAPSSRHFV